MTQRKPYKIEWRCPKIKGFERWRKWKRYETEMQRDQALKCLKQKALMTEYRRGEVKHG